MTRLVINTAMFVAHLLDRVQAPFGKAEHDPPAMTISSSSFRRAVRGTPNS